MSAGARYLPCAHAATPQTRCLSPPISTTRTALLADHHETSLLTRAPRASLSLPPASRSLLLLQCSPQEDGSSAVRAASSVLPLPLTTLKRCPTDVEAPSLERTASGVPTRLSSSVSCAVPRHSSYLRADQRCLRQPQDAPHLQPLRLPTSNPHQLSTSPAGTRKQPK